MDIAKRQARLNQPTTLLRVWPIGQRTIAGLHSLTHADQTQSTEEVPFFWTG
jgi:hypothetical protein